MENTIVLSDAERAELNQRAASRSGRADDARRARLLLLLEAGHTWAAIRDKLDCNDGFIDRWNRRFREERLAGLFSRHSGQEASTLTPLSGPVRRSTLVVNQPRGKEIHVIADNLSAHKTGQVDDFLNRHPKVHLHFTPTYSSWLNQIELWFAKIERDVIARGVFTSLADLRRKLMKYIRHYNKVPKTVKWRYFDPTRRITLSSAVTGH